MEEGRELKERELQAPEMYSWSELRRQELAIWETQMYLDNMTPRVYWTKYGEEIHHCPTISVQLIPKSNGAKCRYPGCDQGKRRPSIIEQGEYRCAIRPGINGWWGKEGTGKSPIFPEN
jgi:hypothetical protein